jgi:hypothetical protein
LGTTILDNKRMFGGRPEVDPVRHQIGSAMLWGDLPEKDALYLNITPDNNDGAAIYKLNVQDVPAQRQGLFGAKPVQCLFSEQHHGQEKRGRLDPCSVRRLRRQDFELFADYGGLE